MNKVNVVCPLEQFRRFIILSCCHSFIPQSYLYDESVFPERGVELGAVYVEAEDKVTVERIGPIEFVKVKNPAGAVYNSQSGSTKLRWERKTEDKGRLTGEASIHSILNLVDVGIISESQWKKEEPKKH